jgi:hypothetical protein
MLTFCDAHMDRIGKAAMLPGDVVVICFDTDPQHLGVVGNHRFSGLSIIHALTRAGETGRVLEQGLKFAQNRKFIAAYRLRGME